MNKRTALFLRNFVFGVEDSLVSTVGLVSGVAVAGMARSEVVLTGVVLVFVEAFSMGVGSFLSERSAEEYESGEGTDGTMSARASVIMFFSYFVAGFVPLGPYLVLPVDRALWFSIGASLLALFGLGMLSARISRTRPLKGGSRMLLMGGVAIALGVLVGTLLD